MKVFLDMQQVKCKCGHETRYDKMFDHAKECELKAKHMICPLGCSQKILTTEDYNEHYEKCPKALVHCDICNRNFPRKDMAEHRIKCEKDPRQIVKDMARWRIAAADCIIIGVFLLNMLYSATMFWWPIAGWVKLAIAYVWYQAVMVSRDFVSDLKFYGDVLEDLMGKKVPQAQRAVSWTDRDSILEKCTYQAGIIGSYFLAATFMIQARLD